MNRHHVRTARWIGSTPVFVATVAAAVVLILATIDFLEARGSRCYLGAYFYNKDRKIGRGAYIREECDTNFGVGARGIDTFAGAVPARRPAFTTPGRTPPRSAPFPTRGTPPRGR